MGRDASRSVRREEAADAKAKRLAAHALRHMKGAAGRYPPEMIAASFFADHKWRVLDLTDLVGSEEAARKFARELRKAVEHMKDEGKQHSVSAYQLPMIATATCTALYVFQFFQFMFVCPLSSSLTVAVPILQVEPGDAERHGAAFPERGCPRRLSLVGRGYVASCPHRLAFGCWEEFGPLNVDWKASKRKRQMSSIARFAVDSSFLCLCFLCKNFLPNLELLTWTVRT